MTFSPDFAQGVNCSPQPPTDDRPSIASSGGFSADKNDRPVPAIGQLYQHYVTGNTYRVACVEASFPEDFLNREVFRWMFADIKCKSNISKGDTVVFYEPWRTGQGVYARSLSNFLEVLSSGPNDRASNYYRFTLVEDVEVLS